MLALGLLTLLISAPPSPPRVASPALRLGEELVYEGSISERGTRLGNEYRRQLGLRVRVIVLATHEGNIDTAVLTQLRPLEDDYVKDAAQVVAGNTSNNAPATAMTSLEFLRLHPNRTPQLLKPTSVIPVRLNAATSVQAIPPLPVDAPASMELGMFVPLQGSTDSVSGSWTITRSAEPDTEWKVGRTAVRDGAQLVELVGEQQTADWENSKGTTTAWRREDRVWVSPSDGLARFYERTVEQKEGIYVTRTRKVQAEMLPGVALHRDQLNAIRREIGFAHSFRLQFEEAEQPGSPTHAHDRLMELIRRYKRDHEATPYRDAVEAVYNRCEARSKR